MSSAAPTGSSAACVVHNQEQRIFASYHHLPLPPPPNLQAFSNPSQAKHFVFFKTIPMHVLFTQARKCSKPLFPSPDTAKTLQTRPPKHIIHRRQTLQARLVYLWGCLNSVQEQCPKPLSSLDMAQALSNKARFVYLWGCLNSAQEQCPKPLPSPDTAKALPTKARFVYLGGCLNGSQEQGHKPGKAVLVHGVHPSQVSDAEEEQAGSDSHGAVLLPGSIDLLLSALSFFDFAGYVVAGGLQM